MGSRLSGFPTRETIKNAMHYAGAVLYDPERSSHPVITTAVQVTVAVATAVAKVSSKGSLWG
jgi:hypothetical protein